VSVTLERGENQSGSDSGEHNGTITTDDRRNENFVGGERAALC